MRDVLGVGRLLEGGGWSLGAPFTLFPHPQPACLQLQSLKLSGAEIPTDMYVGGSVWGVGLDEWTDGRMDKWLDGLTDKVECCMDW